MDLPPGTGEVQQTLLATAQVAGAVLVVTPQDVAHLDAKKALQVYKRAGVRILGGVENMSRLARPHCGLMVDLFARVPEPRSLWDAGVFRLGDIPFDTAISQAGDDGHPLMVSRPDSAQANAFRHIAAELRRRLAG